MTTDENMKILMDLVTEKDDVRGIFGTITLDGFEATGDIRDELKITNIKAAKKTLAKQKGIAAISVARTNPDDSVTSFGVWRNGDPEMYNCTRLKVTGDPCFECDYYNSCIAKQYLDAKK